MTNSKDLFDDNAMSFGDHLEALRIHLWKSIIGLIVCCIFALLFSGSIIGFIRGPIDKALQAHGQIAKDDIGTKNIYDYLKEYFNGTNENPESGSVIIGSPESGSFIDDSTEKESVDQADPKGTELAAESEDESKLEAEPEFSATLKVDIKKKNLMSALHQIDPKKYPLNENLNDDQPVSLEISSPLFAQMRKVIGDQNKPVVLTVQEAFMTYLKVALVSGFVMSSPWIFYQMWLFVSAGLYPHEQKYIYRYLPLSLGLFFGGALFCFYLVFPFILDFLLGFTDLLGANPQIRLSEWISFALILPCMFGLSFQLPIVMLFLDKINIFSAEDYREKRRLAVLVISVVSMLMTPADPVSMILMMAPLLVLYECGILLCGKTIPPESPFEEADAF